MALIKGGPLAQAISGTVAGSNFVNAARAPYVRQKKSRVPITGATQLVQQANLVRIMNRWRTLTTAQRLAWNVAAQALSRKNRLGISRPITGRQFFIGRNMRNLQWFGSTIATAPPPMIETYATTKLLVTNPSSGTIDLAFDPDPIPASYFIMVSAARTFSVAPPPVHIPYWTKQVLASTGVAYDWYSLLNASLGPPQLNEVIAYRLIARDSGGLDSGEVVGFVTMTNP
jgi:hypothetical protein